MIELKGITTKIVKDLSRSLRFKKVILRYPILNILRLSTSMIICWDCYPFYQFQYSLISTQFNYLLKSYFRCCNTHVLWYEFITIIFIGILIASMILYIPTSIIYSSYCSDNFLVKTEDLQIISRKSIGIHIRRKDKVMVNCVCKKLYWWSKHFKCFPA